MRIIPNISECLQGVNNILQTEFIPAITGITELQILNVAAHLISLQNFKRA